MLQNAVLNIYKRFCDFKDFISEPNNNYMLTNLRLYYNKIKKLVVIKLKSELRMISELSTGYSYLRGALQFWQ